MRRSLAFLAAATLAAALPRVARADVTMSAAPIFGDDAPPGDHWSAVVVRLEGNEPAIVRGTVEISAASGFGAAASNPTSVAPFSLAPGASTLLRVPTHAVAGFELVVTARDAGGKELAKATVRATSGAPMPVLVDVAQPSRLGLLRGARLAMRRDGQTLALALGVASVDPATGDPILPEHAAEYAGASAVVLPSDLLARMSATEVDALVGWVLAGGTVAIAVKRPEDLVGPTITALVGGEAREVRDARHLTTLPSPAILRDPRGTPPALPPPVFDPDEDPPVAPTPPPKTGTKLAPSVLPTSATREGLHVYEGGNLVRTEFGVSAAYGLGEVHLLPFDPSAAGVLDDPWVASRLAELTRHAADRRASIALPLGASGALGGSGNADVRRQLDPNESSKWATAIAALLLLVYAAIAGPLNFTLATRAGKPLRALRVLPVISLAAFLLVAGISVAAKGLRGEARRLSLIETSGGMTRGAIRRYRGLFTSRARDLAITATDASGVLGVALASGVHGRLVAERGGLRLEGVALRPWETVVVREDALTTLGGGVAIVRTPGGGVTIVNRSAHDLRALVVHVPGRGLFTFPKLADGQRVDATTGAPSGTLSGTPKSGRITLHGLDTASRRAFFDDASDGLASAWEALESGTRGGHVTWWPEDVPALVAQIDGGEGSLTDSGLHLGKDRLLLRVVGYGGTP